MKIRPIAIHLPQFHPIPENDTWWGKGFTEWTNVTKAKPLFKGHYQPHLPADLGFYDLRVPEVRMQQAELAKQSGIYGFCYYHYWFNGKQVLQRPVEELLKSGQPDFPFMLCWANENWTRAWDGGEKQILLKQEYSAEDDKKHFSCLLPFFKDERYIRVNNKPVFCIYRASLFPDIKKTIATWRQLASAEGLELYLCCFHSLGEKKEDPQKYGFDGAIQFPPFGIIDSDATKPDGITFQRLQRSFVNRIRNQWNSLFAKANYIAYDDLIEHDLKKFPPSYKLFPAVTPGWDNTARRKRPTIVRGSSPQKFGYWVQQKLKRFQPYSDEENFLFINAWNEWAEGNHLEPCQKWGSAYLEAFKNSLKDE
jgi:lipopolysaccharide biosynthesis protein